jgi:acyl-ACP thioesterase
MQSNILNFFSDAYFNSDNVSSGHQTYTYQVLGTDTDYKDRLQMDALFSMLQEAASVNASDQGWGYEKLDGDDYCWILLRISAFMEHLPAWRDQIVIETWSRGAEKLYFHRDFIIRNQKGERLGAASSVWILADRSSHKPVRPGQVFGEERLRFDEKSVLTQEPPKLKTTYNVDQMISGTCMDNSIVKYADFSEIDRNLHVNNTRYVAWSVDAAHRHSLEQGDIIGIDICYLSEIRFGEKVLLFYKDDDSSVHIDGFCENSQKTAFSACLYRAE